MTCSNHTMYRCNKLGEILKEKYISQYKFCKFTGLSMSTISRIINNPKANITEDMSLVISEALHIGLDDWHYWRFNDLYAPNGFTNKHLKLLDKEMAIYNVSLVYQPYNSNNAVNICTKRERIRREYLNANMRVDMAGLPEMTIVDFDVMSHHNNLTIEEISNFYANMLRAMINFAREMGMYQLKYYTKNFGAQEYLACHLTRHDQVNFPSSISLQNKRVAKKLGFRQATLSGNLLPNFYVMTF
ncbi:helix-turn-helix transcriptional regulator [Secundilactobacillus folii]|uniref:Helix-turn-helix domain-containing protein n=1 Tax=Secundilactobacillus folii TaxID=2678357 RepID=A0A7X3C3E5_9LACO|nr:helix-turn-helix domain-containing protein [Secundilactobacillus folii]MTV82199.1 helix-turn-helix domain-containing protein [Secundilactobacillus folii]